MAKSELRVHGVSGTPPRDIIFTDPVREKPHNGATGEYANVFVKPNRDQGFDVRAFHWGGLTAGSRWTAFWILLGPFALANAAGWMTKRQSRVGRMMIRIVGLCITALFADQLATAVILLPDRRLLAIDVGWRPAAVAVLGLAAAFIVLFSVVQFSLRSHTGTLDLSGRIRLMFGLRPETMVRPEAVQHWTDPATSATVLDDEMWVAQPLLERLTRIHLAAALGMIALDLSTWTSGMALTAVIQFVLLSTIGGIAALTMAPENRVTLWWNTLLPHAALAAVLATVLAVSAGQPRVDGPIHSVTLGLGVVLGIATILAGTFAGIRVMGALVLAIQFGAVLGIVVALVGEGILGLESEIIGAGAGWVSVAMVFLLAALALSIFVLMAVAKTDPPDDDGPEVPVSVVGPRGLANGLNRAFFLFRRAEQRASRLLTVAAVYGAGVAALAVWRLVRYRLVEGTWLVDPTILGTPGEGDLINNAGVVVGLVLLLCLVAFVDVAWGHVAAAGALVASGLVVLAARGGLLSVDFLGVESRVDGGIVELAVFLAAFLPGTLLLKSIFTGIRPGPQSGDHRRQVGILWDLTTFWPRWYHPLGPPAYGPLVVGALRDRLESRPTDVLGAHSQGSLIAAIAVGRTRGQHLPGAFLTHGSQLGVLYPDIFPDVGLDDLRDRILEVLPSRWINIWRYTDPIGGHYVAGLDEGNILVKTGSGHSGYELTPEYGASREAALAIPRVTIDTRPDIDSRL